MQTDVLDVSGNQTQDSKPTIIQKIIEVIKDDIADTIEVVRETEKLSKL
jgi:hypothetical protein